MYISLDLETTGFDPAKDKIIEFGAVKFDKTGPKETLSFLCNPGFAIPQVITHITKIKDSDLEGTRPFEERMEEVKAFIGNLPIVGHNIEFDINFLRSFGLELPNNSYDTQKLVSILIPSLPSYSLEVLTQIFELNHAEKHRALDDSIAAMELFLKAQKNFSELDADLLSKLKEVSNRTNNSLKFFLNDITHLETSSQFALKNLPTEAAAIPQNTENFAPLLHQQTSALIESTPPYSDLAIYLSSNLKEKTLIALPHELFLKIHQQLPPEVSQIDTPSSYVSPTRLQEFAQKETFEEHELISLLKYLVWIKQTKTGLLSEVTLFNKEKNTIYSVNCDPNFTNTEEEPYLKATHGTSPVTITTHRQVIETPVSTERLIIIDLESFIRTLTSQSSLYLKAESLLNTISNLETLYPENEIVKSLLTKTTILFGTLGILFDKYNDKNPFAARAKIFSPIFTTIEWANFRSTFANIIELSKLLVEIQNAGTQVYLKNWKRQLTEIHDFIKESEDATSMTWIESENEEIVLRKTPLSITTPLKKILDNTGNYQLIGEGLDLKDNGNFIKSIYNLPQDLPVINLTQETNNYATYIIKDFRDDLTLLARILKEKQATNPGRLAVICNAKQQLNLLTLKLSENGTSVLSQMTCSQGKINEKLKNEYDKSVLLITPNTWNNLQNPQLIDTVILQKLPFDPPSDPTIMSLSENLPDAFNKIQIPRTIINLKKIITRLSNNGEKPKQLIILDERLVTKDYGESILKNLKNTSPIATKDLLPLLLTQND